MIEAGYKKQAAALLLQRRGDRRLTEKTESSLPANAKLPAAWKLIVIDAVGLLYKGDISLKGISPLASRVSFLNVLKTVFKTEVHL